MAAQTRPTYAHVAAIRVPEFAAHGVAEQAALKERLETLAREALEELPRAERVVLDADDGVAIVLFGEAARALDWLARLAPRAAAQSFQVGLNYGPLALTAEGPGGSVFGDGIAAAQVAARFATPQQPLVTEDFRRALQAAAPDRARELANAGDFTDSRVRQHTFYRHDASRAGAARRRRFALRAGVVAAILLAGVAGRVAWQQYASRPAIVVLDVKPRGEIFVDGVLKGRSPPLARLEVAPGRRQFQVRLPGQAPYEVTMELKGGQEATLTYTFPRAPSRPESLWQDFKKKFGN